MPTSTRSSTGRTGSRRRIRSPESAGSAWARNTTAGCTRSGGEPSGGRCAAASAPGRGYSTSEAGTGFYIDRWRELGITDVTGSDLTGFAVERLREPYPEHRIHKIDVTSASPLDLGSFDAVSAMDMLFHIVDEEGYARAVRNLAGLLPPGGLLVLTENFVHRDTRHARHEVDRSLEEISSLLEGAGLVIESRRPLFVLMNTPVDSDSRFLEKTWTGVNLMVRHGPRSANLVGALLFTLDLALTRVLREGPSTEIVVCRKPVAPS